MEEVNTNATDQQATSSQSQTGNPQSSIAGGNSLQGASSQSIEAIRALDQGTEALQLAGVNNTVALPPASSSLATTTQPAQASDTSASTSTVVLYGGIILLVVAFMAVLARALLRPNYSKRA